jgi:hypothetical protein
MRIAAKRLRYTLELFRPELGTRGEQQIGRIKSIQEALGTFHDHDVRIALIGDELTRLMLEQSHLTRQAISEVTAAEQAGVAAAARRPPPDDARRGLIALLGREHEARREAYAAFRTLWDRLAAEGMRRDLVSLSMLPTPRCACAPEDAA